MVQQAEQRAWRRAKIEGKWVAAVLGLARQSGFRKLDLMERDLLALSSQRPQDVRRWLLFLVLGSDADGAAAGGRED